MADNRDYWQREINQPGSQRRDNVEEPLNGWWRSRGAKTKWDWPAVVWTDTQGLTWAQVGHAVPFEFNTDAWYRWYDWSFVKSDAVTEEEYLRAMDKGFWDDGKLAHRPFEDDDDITPQRGNYVGDDPSTNAAPPLDELADMIDAIADQISKIEAVNDQATADRMAGLLDRMRKLWKQSDEARAKEKEPHLTESRVVDSKWRPLLTAAETAGGHGKLRLNKFLIAEENRLREEARKQREAEDAAARAAAEAAGGDAPAEAPQQQGRSRQPPEPVARAHSEYGKAASLTTRAFGVIENETKFINAIKGGADFKEFIQKKADALARAGQTVNGMVIEKRRV
jgi:hypothetical protein